EAALDLRRDRLLPRCGAIRELRAKRRSSARIDAERGRALRRKAEEILGKLVEQCANIGLDRRSRRRHRRFASASLDKRQDRGRRERRERFAAADRWNQEPSLR